MPQVRQLVMEEFALSMLTISQRLATKNWHTSHASF
jgi:hypothetical protein